MLELRFRRASTTAHQVAQINVNFGATWRPDQKRQDLEFPISCRYIQGLSNSGNQVSVAFLVTSMGYLHTFVTVLSLSKTLF